MSPTDEPPFPSTADLPAGTPPTLAQTPDELARVAASLAPAPITIPGYELLQEVGKGGMGVVYRARDLRLGRDVAVKLIRPEYAGAPELALRFRREAAIAARLPHPNIPPVHALDQLPDGRPFMVMKLIHGRTLEELLEDRREPLAHLSEHLQTFLQVCNALAFAHSEGVIHRDLKPGNVMVGRFGEVQVMDWGLAKRLSAGAGAGADAPEAPVEGPVARLTHGALGTPGFMAPEQARGEHAAVDRRADVFALGAMLCTILTGLPPFVGPLPFVMARSAAGQMGEANVRLTASRAPAELVKITRACLAPDPAGRPADASAVADQVRRWMESVQDRERRRELTEVVLRDRMLFAGRGLTARRTVALLTVVCSFGLGTFVLVAGSRDDYVRFGGVVLMIPGVGLLIVGGSLVLLDVFSNTSVFFQTIFGGRSKSPVGAGEVEIPKDNPFEDYVPPAVPVAPPEPAERPVRRGSRRHHDRLRQWAIIGLCAFAALICVPVLMYGLSTGFRTPPPPADPDPPRVYPTGIPKLPLLRPNVEHSERVSREKALAFDRYHAEWGAPPGGVTRTVLDRRPGTWTVSYFTPRADALSPEERKQFAALPSELSARVFDFEPVVVQVCRASKSLVGSPEVVASFR